MLHLPWLLSAAFILITLVTLLALFSAAGQSKKVLRVSGIWLLLQAAISLSGFYTVTDTLPPRFAIAVLPPLIFVAWLVTSPAGKLFTTKLSLQKLALLHTVRVPVELGLYFLSVHKVIPGLMTFEGSNFDIVAGLTAPLVYYFGFVKNKFPRKLILTWNFIGIGLLANIVIRALLSAPFPTQQFAFDQPNIAILYFPFVWLACFIVPVVLYAHLASIRKLWKRK
ncbi:MAG: hypothetical protein ABIR30_06005 [Chitinophagaceae bacterium]